MARRLHHRLVNSNGQRLYTVHKDRFRHLGTGLIKRIVQLYSLEGLNLFLDGINAFFYVFYKPASEYEERSKQYKTSEYKGYVINLLTEHGNVRRVRICTGAVEIGLNRINELADCPLYFLHIPIVPQARDKVAYGSRSLFLCGSCRNGQHRAEHQNDCQQQYRYEF